MSEPLLELKGLEHAFGSRRVLQGVDLRLSPGEVLLLAGPNGSGKSTLLKLIAGLLDSQQGVFISGEESSSWTAERRARWVAYVGAELRAEFPLTAEEAVAMAAQRFRGGMAPRATRTAMEACFCWHLRERELQSLSGGERQRVALARALAQDPRILLIDESLSKMDLHHQAQVGGLFSRLCREQGKAVILVSHDLNSATDWSDRCALLHRGVIQSEGRCRDVLTKDNLSQVYPGIEIEIEPGPFSGAPKVHFRSKP